MQFSDFEFFPATGGALVPPPRFDNKLLHSFQSKWDSDQWFLRLQCWYFFDII